MTYNPFLPPGFAQGYGSVNSPFSPFASPAAPVDAEIVEEKDEAIDPERFADVFVNGRYTPGKKPSHIDLSFGNLNLEDAVDFFKYLASEDGQDELVRSLVSLFVERGDITVLEAINILSDD